PGPEHRARLCRPHRPFEHPHRRDAGDIGRLGRAQGHDRGDDLRSEARDVLAQGLAVQPRRDPHLTAMTFDEAIARFVPYLSAERGFSENTVIAYRADLGRLAGFAERAGVSGPDGLGLELLRDWLWEGTQQGLSKSTIARRSVAARSFTSWLAQTGEAQADAGARLRSPRPDKHLPRGLTRAQRDGMLESLWARASTGGPVAGRDVAIVELLYASALRVSELVGLDLGDVDLERLTVRVMGKGSK